MGSIIRDSCTIFYLLVYFNSQLGFNGPKYVYSVISVNDNLKRLSGNTKKWTIAPFVDGQSAISRIVGGVYLCPFYVFESWCKHSHFSTCVGGCDRYG